MKNIKLFLALFVLTTAFATANFAQQTVSLPALNGQPVSIQNHKGKVVVLALGASWLPLSRNQALISNRLAKKYAGKDVVFYFVATDSNSQKSKNYASDEQIRVFAAKNAISVPILRDFEGMVMLKNFKVDQIPSYVIFDKSGKIAGEPFGGISPNAENDFIDQVSAKINDLL